MVTAIKEKANGHRNISSEERAAMTSDEAFQVLSENLETHVEAAIHQLPSLLQKVAGQDEGSVVSTDPEEEPVVGRGLGDAAFVSELVVHPDADPVDLFRICEGLKSRVKAELLSIGHSKEGTTIRCTVSDPVKLLCTLNKLGKLAAWSLAPRPAPAAGGIGD